MKVLIILSSVAMALAFPLADGSNSGNSGNQCSQDFNPVCCNSNGLLGFTCIAQGIFGIAGTCNGQVLCCQANENQVGLINIGGCVQI